MNYYIFLPFWLAIPNPRLSLRLIRGCGTRDSIMEAIPGENPTNVFLPTKKFDIFRKFYSYVVRLYVRNISVV